MKMKKLKKLAMLLFGVFALSTSAQAAVYDFVGAAAAVNEGGYKPLNTNDAGWAGILPGGLIAEGYSSQAALDAGNQVFAYLDGLSAGGPGGLGVCGILAGAEVPPPADGTDCNSAGGDNIQNNEILRIDLLAGAQTIIAMAFTDHLTDISNFNVDYRVNSDDGAFTTVTFAFLSSLQLNNVDTIDFRESATGGNKFYLASLEAVPLPAAAWLFGTAMLGLFGLRRKNKSKALAA
jgi:hypothetical protein